MSSSYNKAFVPLVVGIVVACVAVGLLLALGNDDSARRWMVAWALIASVPAFGLPYVLGASAGESESASPLIRNVADSRNEVINAMSILQQEIRLLQDARKSEGDSRLLREEVGRLANEIAALKLELLSAPRSPAAEPARPAPGAKPAAKPAAKKPAPVEAEEDEDFDVAPLSFDDDDTPPPEPKKKTPAPAPKAAAPARPAPKPEPVFEPEPVAEDKGLEPEDMEDDGDWLSGGLEEDDLIVSKKIDFDAIVKKDAARPKPVVDPEEQRALREEMAQMADSDDWVGGGLQDRDVKVRKSTSNDALFDKFRAEIEAKRNARESATGVRAPARGETALIANVTLPTGAKLFVRGVGPGLNVDRGVPMQQSGHGKWQWICGEQGKACVITIWENDQVQAEGNPVRVPAGFALTVTPTFRRKIKL